MYVVLTILAVLALGANGQSCSNCQNGYCDTDGNCEYGCEEGWYGSSCGLLCDAGCLYGVCDQNNGACLLGCVNGTQGVFCDTPCDMGCSDGYGGCMALDYDHRWCDRSDQCHLCGCQGQECISWGWPSSAATALSAAFAPTLLLLGALATKYMLG